MAPWLILILLVLSTEFNLFSKLTSAGLAVEGGIPLNFIIWRLLFLEGKL